MEKLIPHKHIERGLLLRLLIFLAVALIILGIVVRDIVVGELAFSYAVFGFVGGSFVGYVLGRILNVTWHPKKRVAVLQMDVAGFIVIGVYIIFRLVENWLLSHWIDGVTLSTLSLAILGGALFGRFLGLHISIVRLVEENTGNKN